MRWEKAGELLRLARLLAGSGEGVPMARMCDEMGVGRRTVERMLGAVEAGFGPVERRRGDGAALLYSLPVGAGDRLLTAVRPAELAELEHAAEAARRTDTAGRAAHLDALHSKLRAAMRTRERLRVDADLEGLMEAEVLARRPGPHARVPADVLHTLRTALLAGLAVGFRYGAREEPFGMVPYGILFGLRSYPVCAL